MSRKRGYSQADLDSLLGGKENTAPEWSGDTTVKSHTSPVPTGHNTPLSTGQGIIRRQDYKGKVPLQKEVYLTDEDWKVLRANFPTATCIQYSYPFIVICGTVPPPEPITVKGLIVEFYNDISEFQYCPGEVGNPTIKDPLPAWDRPVDRRMDTFESIEGVLLQLSVVMGIEIHSLTTYLHLLIIEVDDKDFNVDVLPGKVAGRITMWGTFGSLWGQKMATATRAKDPASSSGDNTNYISSGLSPGVKVCGNGMSTTSGALLTNINTGQSVISIADHGWKPHEDIVYHPDESSPIGLIEKRYPDRDLSLVSLAPDITYTNAKYFDAPVPVTLSTEKRVEENLTVYSFFAADGFTCGACWMSFVGFRDLGPVRLSDRHAVILRVARACLPQMAMVIEGICGAPVVHQEDDNPLVSNICIGFFSQYDGSNAVVPVVEYLINEGWEIA